MPITITTKVIGQVCRYPMHQLPDDLGDVITIPHWHCSCPRHSFCECDARESGDAQCIAMLTGAEVYYRYAELAMLGDLSEPCEDFFAGTFYGEWIYKGELRIGRDIREFIREQIERHDWVGQGDECKKIRDVYQRILDSRVKNPYKDSCSAHQ